MQDDLTESKCSPNSARFLINSYQWESINECLTLKVGDLLFNTHSREFGREIYSVQVHPESDGCCVDKEEVKSRISLSPRSAITPTVI